MQRRKGARSFNSTSGLAPASATAATDPRLPHLQDSAAYMVELLTRRQ
jgi:hypothetical protein